MKRVKCVYFVSVKSLFVLYLWFSPYCSCASCFSSAHAQQDDSCWSKRPDNGSSTSWSSQWHVWVIASSNSFNGMFYVVFLACSDSVGVIFFCHCLRPVLSAWWDSTSSAGPSSSQSQLNRPEQQNAHIPVLLCPRRFKEHRQKCSVTIKKFNNVTILY